MGEKRDDEPLDLSEVFYHAVPKHTCKHDFKGWRDFPDGRGGEQVCANCGMGAMQHSLRYGP